MRMAGASGRSVTTVTRFHASCLPGGPHHQTHLSYEPDRDRHGLLMVVVLRVFDGVDGADGDGAGEGHGRP